LNTPADALAEAARRRGVGTDVLLGIGGIQRVRRVGDEDRPVVRRAPDQRAGRQVDGLATVDVAELAAAGDVELEVQITLRDAGDLLAEPVDAEDLAEEIQVLTGGVVDQRLPKVEELVGLHHAELVAYDVAETPMQNCVIPVCARTCRNAELAVCVYR
jgi:hypothetical protein